MRNSSSMLGLLAALALAAPAANAADTFRCGARIIRKGLASAEIKRRCGEPQSVEHLQEPIMATRPDGTRFEVGTKTWELWTYEREYGKFPARVTVEDGVATAVELLTGGSR